jgi:hypothetical protein
MQYNDAGTIFLQEMVYKDIQCIAGHTAHTNIGTKRQGTAILTRDTAERTAIKKLPNGRVTEA